MKLIQGGGFMQDDAWQEFSERISCEDAWHADCLPVEWPLPSAQLRRLTESNLNALAAVAALEERRVEGVDEDSALVQEMLRLDAKLTALVDIVNRLLVPADALPKRQVVRFNTLGAVVGADMLRGGEAVLLRVRLDACLSLPLEFPARIDRHLDGNRVFLAFAPLGDASKDALERLVFRHHRRKVAEARQSGG